MRKIVSFLLVTFILLVVGCERAKIDERGLENPIANCEKIISELNDTLSEDKERQEISDSVTQVKPDNKKEIKSCQKNTECMFVPKSCVGMGGVGKPKAINVKFLEYYYKNVLEDCKEFNIGDYLIYFGRLSQEKGIDVLLKAMTGQNIKLKIVGDGLVKSSGDIEWLGYKTGEELKNLISREEGSAL